MYARAGTQSARVQDVLLAAAGVLALVFSNILYKRMAAGPHPVVLNGAQLLSAGIALLPAAMALEGAPHLTWTGPVFSSLAYLVIVLSVGASMLSASSLPWPTESLSWSSPRGSGSRPRPDPHRGCDLPESLNRIDSAGIFLRSVRGSGAS